MSAQYVQWIQDSTVVNQATQQTLYWNGFTVKSPYQPLSSIMQCQLSLLVSSWDL